MTLFMQLLWYAIIYCWVLLPILFILGLYALLRKPRWRHFGICSLALSANLMIIFGIISAYVMAGRDDIPYQYGHWYFFIGFIGLSSFLVCYSQHSGWPTWKMAAITITGGILYALLYMALGLRFCFWIGNSCP